ncbi:MAG: DUF5317 domain-containing protein [Spirochaetota bacterium]
MIPVTGILLGVVVGFARGGTPGKLSELRFAAIWVLFLSLIIQILIFPWILGTVVVDEATAVLHLVSYTLAGLFLLLNISRLWPVLPGAFLNILVIAVNGGYMPSDPDALRRAGELGAAEALAASSDGTLANVRLMTDTTRLNLLGDRLFVPEWVPLATAFSIGDVLIAVGIAWIIQAGMKRFAPER